MFMSSLLSVQRDLRGLANPAKAHVLRGFFKTGPGEYGEGDLFLGVTMPQIRELGRRHALLDGATVQRLLGGRYHEERMLGLVIMVKQFQVAREPDVSTRIFHDYLEAARQGRINNWDLVDVTAPHVVGAYLFDRSRRPLTRLARSSPLWERRIAMVATQYFIQRGESRDALHVADMLLHDSHDLIHKAVGWMLREVGKHCSVAILENFLSSRHQHMPRTMLRYAIERLPKAKRRAYLNGRTSVERG